MTDDKGAGDGPFSSEPLTETSTIVCKCYPGEISTYGWVFCCLDGAYAAKLANSAFEEGRKAERDRNWKTVVGLCGVNPHTYRPCIEKVEEKLWCPICKCADAIKGGQDAKSRTI